MIIRLTTAAAALLLGINFAAAQTKTDLPPEPAPPSTQNAPAEIIAPPMNAGERNATTSGQNLPTTLAPGSGENVDKQIKEPSGKDATDMKGSSPVDGTRN